VSLLLLREDAMQLLFPLPQLLQMLMTFSDKQQS
jgi:hypothetical protein